MNTCEVLTIVRFLHQIFYLMYPLLNSVGCMVSFSPPFVLFVCMGAGKKRGISKVREIAANEILQLLDGPVEEAPLESAVTWR